MAMTGQRQDPPRTTIPPGSGKRVALEVQVEGLRGSDSIYVDDCYRRITELKTSVGNQKLGLDDLKAGIERILDEIATKDGSYSATVNSLLMRHWTSRGEDGQTRYDKHMAEHVAAIQCLTSAWLGNLWTRLKNGSAPIKILDATCGTGTVLQTILNTIPELQITGASSLASRISVMANDLSVASIESAKRLLSHFSAHIEYTQVDILAQVPKENKFDIVILSQTLPFLGDDTVLKAGRVGSAHEPAKHHLAVKTTVLEKLLGRVKPFTGQLIVIDEHEQILTETGFTPDDVVESVLFNAIFMKVDKETLIQTLRHLPGSRFRGQLETPIDKRHHMYLIATERLPKKGEGSGMDSERDEDKVRRVLGEIHPFLVERLRSMGITESKKRMNYGATLTIGPANIGETGEWRKNGFHDTLVLSGITHTQKIDGLNSVLDRMMTLRRITPGSAILLVDRWSAGRSPNEVSNREFRERMGIRADMTFLSSYRSGEVFGYLYLYLG